MSRIVFLCCHLSGTGHLVRTLTLARAARARGHDVTVISGGRPLDHVDASGIDLVQLPPLLVRDLDFKTFWTPEGTQADPGYMAMRRQLIGSTIEAVRAQVLVTELYPFGRRSLADEFRHAIRTTRRTAAGVAYIICSVRDVPEPKPHRMDRVAQSLASDFHAVLVHGDEDFLSLSETWPKVTSALLPVFHTGYVGRRPPLALARNPGVLVAVGGGTLGQRLLETAAAAAALSDRDWLVLVGGPDAAERAAAIGAEAALPNLRVEPPRGDYRALMASADCSVSLCGYNTAVELAQCRTPAVLVPSEEGGEQEQLIRARQLSGHEGFRLLRENELTPRTLADAAEAAASAPRRNPVPLALDDGTTAIARIEEIVTGRRVSA